MSPLQVCLNGSKEAVDLGARLPLCSMPKNPEVKHTFMTGTNDMSLLAD